MPDETEQKIRSECIKKHIRKDCSGQEGSDPSLSIEIPDARGRVWAGPNTVLTKSEETTMIPRRGDAVK
jgi:hypothetical protein